MVEAEDKKWNARPLQSLHYGRVADVGRPMVTLARAPRDTAPAQLSRPTEPGGGRRVQVGSQSTRQGQTTPVKMVTLCRLSAADEREWKVGGRQAGEQGDKAERPPRWLWGRHGESELERG